MGKKGKKSSRSNVGKKSSGGVSVTFSAGPSSSLYRQCRDHFRKTMKKLPHDEVVSRVRKGYLLTTLCISEYLAYGPDSQDPANRRFLESLVKEGLVSGKLEGWVV